MRFCELCAASIPQPLAEAMEALGGDEDAEAELGTAYAARQCEELLAGGAPGIHFYTLNKAPATRAVLGALRVARPWERATSRRRSDTRARARGPQIDSPPSWLTRTAHSSTAATASPTTSTARATGRWS